MPVEYNPLLRTLQFIDNIYYYLSPTRSHPKLNFPVRLCD